MKQIDFNQINNIQIVDILSQLWVKINNKNQVYNEWFQNWYDDKYRVDTFKTNSVVNFWNDLLPSWKPFNFVKEYLWLDNVDTFKWFKNFLGIIDDNSFNIKEKKVIVNYVEDRVINNTEILDNRRSMIDQYSKLKNEYYPQFILDYCRNNRGISEKTLREIWVKTWTIQIWEKEYKNRLFFPMKNFDIVWIKARNIFAKDGYPKSINIKDSESWLFWIEENCKWKNHVFFCEWEMDYATLHELWLKNAIWNWAWVKTFKKDWVQILEPFEKIYLFYDNDKNWSWIDGMITFTLNNENKIINIIDYDFLFKNLIPQEFEDEIKDINDIHMYWLTTWLSYLEIWKIISKACKTVTLEDLYLLSIENTQFQIEQVQKRIDIDKAFIDKKIKELNNKLKNRNEELCSFRKTNMNNEMKL